MRLTPSSTARRSVARAAGLSAGGPQMPAPVMRMAPKPRRLTVRPPPMAKVPAAAAVIAFVVVIESLLSIHPIPTLHFDGRFAAGDSHPATSSRAEHYFKSRQLR